MKELKGRSDMKKWLKQLFCKHNYNYWYTDNWGRDNTFKIGGKKIWRCNKCAKLKKLETKNVFYKMKKL